MKLTSLPSEFQEALPILEKIKNAGFEAYFVGGSVRDAVLGRPIHDVDIATSSYPEETKAIFSKTFDIGIEHGTVLVLEEGQEYEITTFRTEEDYVDYRRPSTVHFVRSLEEDLRRRDFTVNAFALDDRAQVIDLFGGLDDLAQKRLRAVGQAGERFNEDALRIMRGFRFVATLNFEIEAETLLAMTSHAPLLAKISVERLFVEMDRLLQADFWQRGLYYLLETKAEAYLPKLKNYSQALSEFLRALPEGFSFTSSEQAWASLLIHMGDQSTSSFMKAWKTSVDLQKKVARLIAIYHIRLERDLTYQDVYTYGRLAIEEVEKLRQAEGLPVDFEAIASLDQQLPIHSRQEIVINGSDLISEFSLKPGPDLGSLLKLVEEEIVAGRLANERETIFNFIRERG